ncbi:hypothetical protein [Polyangium jinanense]|uniref:hypothetical protein n=1 Tax=Polyangium jinanense TaxID=2829994 RepID=UPI002341AE87|nr:hypothetical protein [Polyangium jinanense]
MRHLSVDIEDQHAFPRRVIFRTALTPLLIQALTARPIRAVRGARNGVAPGQIANRRRLARTNP